ncbi:type VII secretion protein EccB, partial [Streptomyces zhihengii]|uniref:type VII secretion protein EccB n=1 Tax=Streptomyces zhihengii TaxID=1818004 RepID=UPI0033B8B330
VLGASGRQVGASAYLVTDTGVKHRIASKEAAEALGYDLAADAQAVPSTLVGMLPTGPDLSPEAAAAGRSGATGTPDCGAPTG